jgi:phospho-N-acetylmuramoyl-pentapeptide-transferase
MLYHLLWSLRGEISWLRVVGYPSTRIIAAVLTSLLLSLLLGPAFIRLLMTWQVGQPIRDDGPQTHQQKAGTPTMGGALILFALVLTTLLWADLHNGFVWIALGVTAGYGAIGFWDDCLKLRRRSSKGLPGKAKLALQAAIALLAALWLLRGGLYDPSVGRRLALPLLDFYRYPIALPLWAYVAFAVLVLVSSSNAVNLTDGLDGLAIGPCIIGAFTLVALAYAEGTILRGFNIARYLRVPHLPGVAELAIFCGAMAAAGVGFLWFNTYPASVFMGDVGSLALGGGLGAAALLTKNEFVWVILGGIFVVEALSVMVQVASFKLTGKRLFRMAPLHHHFEIKGWDEPKIVVRAWIVAFILALVALATLKMR